jgi:hypothetical protein
MDFALHPNLAQIAASYDDICERVQLGLITGPEARTAIMGLVARDDTGVQWTISPDDGLWYRRTRTGELVADTPPRSGIPTPSGWDVSTSDAFGDPRDRIHTQTVDPLRHRSATDLTGSTIAATQMTSTGPRMSAPSDRLKRRIVAVLAAVLLAAAVVMLLRPDAADAPAPSTAPAPAPSSTVAPPPGPAPTAPAPAPGP